MKDSESIKSKSFELNSLLAMRFRLEGKIATGGMGSIYRAVDLKNNNFPVAIKILHSGLQLDQDHLDRFKREVDICSQINHPNVVKIFDLFSENNQLFFSMELIEGKSLEEILRSKPYPIEKIPRLLIEIADGLKAIHSENIIHRDLKPGNIMVQEDGSVKIIDFGISRTIRSKLTRKNIQVGSIYYIAPELWQGKKASPQSDFYALGCMLHEMVYQRVPYYAESVDELMKLHQKADAPDLPETCPIWLDKLLHWSMSKNPKARPHNADEIIAYIREKDPQSSSVQTFGQHMENTIRSGQGAISVFPTLVPDRAELKRICNSRKTLMFSLNATRPAYRSEHVKYEIKRGKTVVIKLPRNAAMVFEFEFPSWDFLFLGVFLASLNAFDWYLTHQGVSRFGFDSEGNSFMKSMILHFGLDQALLITKLLAILIVFVLTIIARRVKFVKNLVATLSAIYLFAAVIPWIYFLYYR